MTIADYKPFIDRVIQRYEGGYGWSKSDTGGPTKYGITCYDLAQHRGQKMDSMSRWAPIVEAMGLAEAEAIYVTKYAAGCRFNELNPGVDCVMLDYGINSGVGRPIAVARALLSQGSGTRMTDALLAAINAADPKWFIDAMCEERLRFMHAIRKGTAWAEYGHGWGARIADLRTYCHHLEVGQTPPPMPTRLDPAPKVVHGTPDLHKNVTAPVTTGGGLLGGIVGYFTGDNATMILVALGTAVVIGSIVAFLVDRKHRADALANETVVLPTPK